MKENVFWKNKKVLVTGHEGFLGSWLTKNLLLQGAEIIGFDLVKKRSPSVLDGFRTKMTCLKGNVANLKLVQKVIDQYKPEVIFHLAAQAIVDEANKNPVEAFKSNIEGTWNLLEAVNGKKFIEAVVVASSDKAYGQHKILPYTESSSLKADHPYDVSKSCADLIAYTYFNTYKVPVCVTRCGNIYGPGDLNFSRILPDAMKSIVKNKTLMIRSDGKFTRDYIYAEDIVSGYLLLAQKLKSRKLFGQAFNFSDEKPMTVIQLLKEINKVCNNKLNYKILNKAKYEIKHQFLDSRKAKRILGWKPKVQLKQGLDATLKWYDDHIT